MPQKREQRVAEQHRVKCVVEGARVPYAGLWGALVLMEAGTQRAVAALN